MIKLKNYDVVIVGKGPAGISAALYTRRANLSTLVIGKDNSSLKKASKIENYYGFELPVSGAELLEKGEKQAERIGVDVIDDEVVSLNLENNFLIKTPTKEYTSDALLIATGRPHNRPKIAGIQEFEGRGVSYCTTCDGFFYRNKNVGILGNGNYAVQEAAELATFTKNITIFTNGQELSITQDFMADALRFNINKKPIKMLDGNETLNEIVFDEGSQKIEGLFVAYGTASSVDFAVKMGVLVDGNAIITDEKQRTNLEGLFAAGDCTGKIMQISTAVGQGAAAGYAIIDYIKNKKKVASSNNTNLR